MNSEVTIQNRIQGSRGAVALKWFSFSAAVILAMTGLAKVWAALGEVKALATADPVVGVSFRHLMMAVGIAELAIAYVCLCTTAYRLTAWLVAWLATNFLVYRIGLWWMGWKKPCSCLGNLTDALNISPTVADNIMKVVLAYLLIGSYGLLIWEWMRARRRRSEVGEQTPGGESLSADLPIVDSR